MVKRSDAPVGCRRASTPGPLQVATTTSSAATWNKSPLGGRAVGHRSAPQVGALQCRGEVGGLIGCADVGAGRDDLVDPVEDVVGQADFEAGEQVVELLTRP